MNLSPTGIFVNFECVYMENVSERENIYFVLRSNQYFRILRRSNFKSIKSFMKITLDYDQDNYWSYLSWNFNLFLPNLDETKVNESN